MIEVTVYQTQKLTDSNGRIPERVVKRFIEEALDRAGFEHDVSRGYNTVSVTTQQAVCGQQSAYKEWAPDVRNERVETAKDSNILLTNATGGGCGAVGGRVATAPGGSIDRDIEYTEGGSGKLHGSIYSTLHELGHNLGASHDHDDDMEGAQHRGMGWNEPVTLFGIDLSWLLGGTWHKTPTVAGNGAKNDCGEMIESRRFDDSVLHHYFHDCAIEHFEVADP